MKKYPKQSTVRLSTLIINNRQKWYLLFYCFTFLRSLIKGGGCSKGERHLAVYIIIFQFSGNRLYTLSLDNSNKKKHNYGGRFSECGEHLTTSYRDITKILLATLTSQLFFCSTPKKLLFLEHTLHHQTSYCCVWILLSLRFLLG